MLGGVSSDANAEHNNNDGMDSSITKINNHDNDVINHDAIYNMSAETGTLRYMAREVYLGEPYGAKIDVYSFSIVMHQVLSLLQPFANVPPSQFESMVIKDGVRPTIDANWPSGLSDLLQRMWSSEAKERPSSVEVHASLEGILRGSNDDLYPTTSFQRLISTGEGCLELPVACDVCPG